MNNPPYSPSHPLLRRSGHAPGLAGLAFLVAASIPVPAQPVFRASDLPSQVGAYFRAYQNLSEEVDVSDRVGAPGGPHRWDFSEPKGTGETVVRTDIVPSNDGGQGARFPVAEYAQRETRESGGSRSWSYYRIVPGLGRSYFGFQAPDINPAQPVVVFDAPTVDIPAQVDYGQSWSRTVRWDDLIDAGVFVVRVKVTFTSESEVDAHGTVVLPEIGEVPALRVHELNTYTLQELDFGLPLPPQRFRNYYWLVPGIGRAVEIIAGGQEQVPPPGIGLARTLRRVFEASELSPPDVPKSVSGLRIRVENDQALIQWDPEPGASGYSVESAPQASDAEWHVLGSPTVPSWTAPLPPEHSEGYFRVLVRP
ncbi:MAG: hypothetical protein KF833_11170 [Verrucomicrobiae bacterium]|nr:hypothetical protein [Verrucomicrobiae bacterium]